MELYKFLLMSPPSAVLMGAIIIVLIAMICGLTTIISRPQKSIPISAPPSPQPKRVDITNADQGECEIHGADDKTAAILMAIVADGIGEPLSNLRFVSIREI